MMQCPHDNIRSWRHDLIRSSLLLTGIQAGWSSSTVSPDLFPSNFRKVIISQEKIGWNLHKGYISAEWDILHSQLVSQERRSNKNWSAKIIQHLWTKWFDLWTLRNSINHGKTVSERLLRKTEFLQQELINLYLRKPNVCHEDLDYFRESLSIHQTEPIHRIEPWLRVFKPAILLSCSRLKEKNNTDLRQFLVLI